MAKKVISSIEERVEDIAKKQLSSIKYYTKTDFINDEIKTALEKAPSKSGGEGTNYPDIKVLIETKSLRRIPVMIEVKGKIGDLIKTKKDTLEIDNFKPDLTPNYANIKKYAVNGAIHYAEAIINYTDSYNECIAIGMNGYKDGKDIKTEIRAFYLSKDLSLVPKEIGKFSDLSFLLPEYEEQLIESISNLTLSEVEKEYKSRHYETQIEICLKNLNQKMEDDLEIREKVRVKLVIGMIMAALGVEGKVSPLEISELKGEKGKKNNDGIVLYNKIESFLAEHDLPEEKQEMILGDLELPFLHSNLSERIDGESKLKTVYTIVKNELMPIFNSARHLDFTGKLFNVLNDWVDRPDGKQNDVVLTPRYVTDFMAKLAMVDMNSFVWDFAVGSAGFLISSMKLKIENAKRRLDSPQKVREKIRDIKKNQLLGIEKEADIYLLAVLNMILMEDGSANILHKSSLEYDGKYEQGANKGKDFPANVFLLNPPYSQKGKGFIFVEKALEKMNNGRAVVLIQENAGSGYGLPYTANILKNNTLKASIKMADVFHGKASVKTAVYVFDIGKEHDPEKDLVQFIDFSYDGYTRLNRKKSAMNVNLRNTDNAIERYEEIINIVLHGEKYRKLLPKECYVEDYITNKGDDWTFNQHKPYETKARVNDFRSVIGDYLCWKISSAIERAKIKDSKQYGESHPQSIDKYKEFKIKELFDIHPTKSYGLTDDKLLKNKGQIPVVSNSSEDNGIKGYVSLEATEEGNMITFSDTTTCDAIFYQPEDFIGYSHVQGLYPWDNVGIKWTRGAYLFFLSAFRRCAFGRFDYATKFTRELANELKVSLPVDDNGNVDIKKMEDYINEVENTQKIIIERALKKNIGIKKEVNELINKKDEEQRHNTIINSAPESNEITWPLSSGDDYQMAAEPFECYKWEGFDQSINDFFGSNQTILIGCYKGKKYQEWIYSHNMYNIRLGKTKGSMEENRELFAKTSLLVLYEFGKPDKLSAYKITGHHEISKDELVELDYPNKKPRKSYMAFDIVPLERDLSFLVEHHLIERLIEIDSNNAKGTPIFIEP